MLDGYDVLLESQLLYKNSVLRTYAQNAYLRVVRYYTKQLIVKNQHLVWKN